MTTKLFEARRKVAFAFILATVSLHSHAQLPQGEFACQVQTQSGQSGLVMVQADAEADAVGAASTAIAWEMDGGQGKAISVVECIAAPTEKFKDTWFNSFYEGFPL
jgi:2',3'-cyclic-nucleotide 2'-phosphodiesterase (5'-nucleotidase family)